MNASQRAVSTVSSRSRDAEALYFSSGSRQLFGWLHGATGLLQSDIGLVICKPFGYEAICSHRMVRTLAEAAANRGIHTLRFDYSGTGDSTDIESNADQLDAWSTDVISAVAELQRRTGVKQVCLLGIRLGVLLALLASKRCPVIGALVGIVPILQGARYVRELELTRLGGQLAFGDTKPFSDEAVGSNDGSMEISGFPMFEATKEALATVDFTVPAVSPADDVLVVDDVTLVSAREWGAALSNLGSRSTYLAATGLMGSIVGLAHLSTVPREMVEDIANWLADRGRSHPRGANNDGNPALSNKYRPAWALVPGGRGDAQGFVERPIFFGSEEALFGILTKPVDFREVRQGVILLNSGATSHVGGSRIHVRLARRWANNGYIVVRLDLPGIGDSETLAGGVDDDVFPPTAIEHIRIVCDYLRSEYGVDRVTLGGLCSGAYHALRSAVSGVPVDRIFMVNPVTFFWEKGMTVHEIQVAQLVRNPGVYYGRIFSLRALKKLMTGRIAIGHMLRVYLNSLVPLESAFRDFARRCGIRLPHDLGRDLEELASRGVRVVIIFAPGEAGIELLKMQGGASVEKLGEACRVHILNGGDHAFSRRDHRSVLEDLLSAELNG